MRGTGIDTIRTNLAKSESSTSSPNDSYEYNMGKWLEDGPAEGETHNTQCIYDLAEDASQKCTTDREMNCVPLLDSLAATVYREVRKGQYTRLRAHPSTT